ncbi:hypothetical protein FA13DRAFT_686859 [Coprinellus micaceus]|uniref:Transmembrane protein n=1 Tax=Coprinellus micaceus TaxID=71717 RepID=A0A4Y7T4L5_COPMI|nr:hypothetical protein FA13DRAFT_686859 [Coprinellus micaceus]
MPCSNTHEFRGRLPRPSTSQTPDDWVQATTAPITSYDGVAHPVASPAGEQYSKPPPYTPPPSTNDATPAARVTDHPLTPPQTEGSCEKVPDWKPALSSTVLLVIWSAQAVHLLTMLWIPRYYENQIRHGALNFEDAAELDSRTPAFRSAYETALERTEAGRNIMDADDDIVVAKFRALWMNFVESRVFEWNILISITLVLIAASPTIFQIPSASSDRLIRTLTFLSISRAVSGLVFGIILSLHFRSPLTKSVAYVRGWFQESRQTSLSLFNFWIVVSLPASSTVWSLILFVSAIFGLVWRTDVLRDEGNSPVLTHRAAAAGAAEEHPLFVSTLRASITILFLVDIAYAIWALIYLQRRTKACLERRVDI